MSDVRADEVAETSVDDDRFAGIECDEVFARVVVGMTLVRREIGALPVAHHRAVLFHVEMERVHPATAAVADLPQVEAALLLLGERRLAGWVLQACGDVCRVERNS